VRRLLLGRRDVVAVAATQRESTRPLLGMIADRLKDRWAQAATVPIYGDAGTADPDDDASVTEDDAAQTTLAEMLGHRKRRRATERV